MTLNWEARAAGRVVLETGVVRSGKQRTDVR